MAGGEMKPILTPELARIAAKAIADSQMKTAGRIAWSDDDYNRAVRAYTMMMGWDYEKDLKETELRGDGHDVDQPACPESPRVEAGDTDQGTP
jgi:hypothetical protein